MLTNANFEPGVTVEHYEFYSQVKFDSSLPRQRSFSERQGPRLGMVYASFVKQASRNAPDPYGATSFFPTRKRYVGRGIFRVENGHHVAYFFENDDLGFDNREVDGLGAFLINQQGGEPNNDPIVVNIGRDFSGQHPRARREALMVPADGYLQTPNRRDMSMKLERIHTSCKIMKLGSVQKAKCTWCRASKGYPEGRECRKLDGVLKCLWCTHGNKVCSLPGEKDVYDEGDGHGDDGKDGDDDGRPGKKFIRTRKSMRTQKPTAKVVDMVGRRTPADRVDLKRSSTSRSGDRTGI